MIIRKAGVIKLKPGMGPEYKRRHDELWPEMREGMQDGPMRNYSIWYYEPANLLFTYSEIDDSVPPKPMSAEHKAVVDRWQVYMSDIIEHVMDPETGEKLSLPLMFLSE